MTASRKKRLKWAAILLPAIVVGSLFLFYAPRAKDRRSAALKTAAYYRVLSSATDFETLQGAPLVDKFGDVRTVKLVYERDGDNLFFINSRKYPYHFDFCRDVLNDNAPIELFNTLNYTATFGRNYYLTNLNFYPDIRRYALEFSSDDRITPGQIAELMKAVQGHTYIRDSLALLIGSDYLQSLDANGKLTMSRLYPSDIYHGRTFQAIQQGEVFGVVRLVDDLSKEFNRIDAHNIIVIKGTPLRIPVCAGVITNSFQTPLSHIGILTHNRHMPSAAVLSGAMQHKLKSLDGKPVFMQVTDDSLHVHEVSSKEAVSHWLTEKPVTIQKLKVDLSVTQLVKAADFDLDNKASIGNKAAQFGELYRISRSGDFSVPQGSFAIPFYFYQQHIIYPAIQQKLATLHDKPLAGAELTTALKDVRKAIKDQPVSPQLLAAISRQITAANAGTAYRFRSSSNAEDREGFSGAGLYDSKTGIMGDTAKSIERAIKAVWASAWSEAAYLERRHAGIDQSTVMMGILAHRSFPDESSNGVAITANLYRPHGSGFVVNVQSGEVSVVSPEDGVTAEQFVCHDISAFRLSSGGIAVDYLTRSSLDGGKPVLTKQQITTLYKVLDRIKSHFYWKRLRNRPLYEDYALDIEFKFDRDNRLYIKQVRAYH